MARGFWRKKCRRGAMWYTRITLPDGSTVCRSTGCTDLEAAKRAKRLLEREAMAEADPTAHKAKEYGLGEALIDFIDGRERAGRAEATLECYRTKSGHLVRIVGEKTDINSLALADVEAFIDQRRGEGASCACQPPTSMKCRTLGAGVRCKAIA